MAVLQKIRNKGPLLVTILGIALLLFILEIAFEALGPAQNAKSQHAGEVNGETVMIQDFQNWVEDWKIYVELTNPNANFKTKLGRATCSMFLSRKNVTNSVLL